MRHSQASSRLLQQLFEVHFSDIFASGFEEFHKKWKGKKKDSSLYVRFDSGETMDSLARGAVTTPDHYDPSAVYAYPLKYVIDHPGDVWYGHNSRYLKVIKDKSRRPVNLTHMTYNDAYNLLRKVDLHRYLDEVPQHFPETKKTITSPGKMFFKAVQYDFTNSIPPRKRGRSSEDAVPPVGRTSEAQRDLLLRMGIDAVKDESTNLDRAVINDREPEQIFWLRPTSFEILETFKLSEPHKHRSNVHLNTEKTERKIAAMIAEVMGDRLAETERSSFWTKGGRLIVCKGEDTSIAWRSKNLKIGQKLHKAYKKDDKHAFQINVSSERGEMTEWVGSAEKIQDAIDRFAIKWKSKEGTDNGERYSKSRRDAEKKAKEKAYYAEERKKRMEEVYAAMPVMVDKLNVALEFFGESKRLHRPTDPDVIANTWEACKMRLGVNPKDDDLWELMVPKADRDIVAAFNAAAQFAEKKSGHTMKNVPPHKQIYWTIYYIDEMKERQAAAA